MILIKRCRWYFSEQKSNRFVSSLGAFFPGLAAQVGDILTAQTLQSSWIAAAEVLAWGAWSDTCFWLWREWQTALGLNTLRALRGFKMNIVYIFFVSVHLVHFPSPLGKKSFMLGRLTVLVFFFIKKKNPEVHIWMSRCTVACFPSCFIRTSPRFIRVITDLLSGLNT